MKMIYIEGSVQSRCQFLNHQLDQNLKMSMLTISVVVRLSSQFKKQKKTYFQYLPVCSCFINNIEW